MVVLVLDEIKQKLARLTPNCEKSTKRMYLKTLGFENWEEITKLDLNSQKELAKKLDKEIEEMLIEVKIGGITIHRPKNLRNVRDMSFRIEK